MSRGPQRTPTALALLTGNERAKSRAATEPTVGYAIPEPPFYMLPAVRPYWDHLIGQVGNLRCISESDATQLEIAAQALMNWAECNAEIAQTSATCISEKGGQYNHPAVNRQAMAYKQLQSCLDRLGLNPSNRSKVTALAPKLGIIEKAEPKKSRYE